MKNRAYWLLLVLFATATAFGQTAIFSSYSISFGNVAINTNATSNITLNNANGNTKLTITSLTASPSQFNLSGSCTTLSSLLPNGSCALTVKFVPTVTGVQSGTITLVSNDPQHPTQTVNLMGVGIAGVSLSPSSVSFGNVNLGTTSPIQTVTLSNNGLLSVSVNTITATAPFSQTSNCAGSLSAGGKCSINVTFRPTSLGSVNGTLTVNYGLLGSSVQSSLSGAGTHTQTGIVVSPSSATINTGDSQQFYAYPTYSDGTTGTTPVGATWKSSPTSVAQVDAKGLVVGDAGGSASISATSGSFTSSAALNVNGTHACSINSRIDMKLLVLTKGQSEADFPAITTALNYLHMPFRIFDTSSGPIVPSILYSGCHAFYNGVIVAFLDGSAYSSASTPPIYPFAGYDVLQTFEQAFRLRQLNWYVFPSPSIGFNWSSGNQLGNTGTFNSQAAPAVFPYVNLTKPLVIDPNAYVYLATPLGTPLLSDANGNGLLVDYSFGDGREYLSNTFDSNQFMLHQQVLSYGLINWVTKGMFVGEKHIFFTPQEDDWGLDDDLWTANGQGQYPKCTSPLNTTTGVITRIKAADASTFVNWQSNWQAIPVFAKIKLYNAFNGCGLGATDANCGSNGSPYPNDTLTAWTQNTANSAHFGWINHTFEHLNLNNNSLATDSSQLSLNINQGQTLGFSDFTASNLVTPDISGLNDSNALQAMINNGAKYLVSDTSCTPEKYVGQTATCDASPNNGPGPGFNRPIINSIQPSITEIPRRPNNLFYNVAEPAGWQNEYQCVYQNQPPYSTYNSQQIKDSIAGSFVSWMLQGDADPEMFHQTNLTAYDGTHSLLSDLLDDTFTLYQRYFNLPVQSMSLDQMGQWMLNSSATDNSGIAGTFNNGSSHSVTLTVTNAATIPVTGLQSASAEQYGGQFISHVPMTAGETLTQPAP